MFKKDRKFQREKKAERQSLTFARTDFSHVIHTS